MHVTASLVEALPAAPLNPDNPHTRAEGIVHVPASLVEAPPVALDFDVLQNASSMMAPCRPPAGSVIVEEVANAGRRKPSL